MYTYIIHMCVYMASQISVSNEVYIELSRMKGEHSFSEIIKKVIEESRGESSSGRSKAAANGLLKLMKKGYPLRAVIKSRDEWHER